MADSRISSRVDGLLGLPDRNQNPEAWNAAVGGAIRTHSGETREELMRRARALQAQFLAPAPQREKAGPPEPNTRQRLLQQADQLRQAVAARANLAKGPVDRIAGPEMSNMQSFARAGVERVLQNGLNLATSVPNTLLTIPQEAISQIKNFGPLPEMLGYERTVGPVNRPGGGPIQLSASPAMAAIDMAGEAAGAARTLTTEHFSKNPIEQANLRSEASADQNPVATTAGRVTGDIASILALRSPFAGARAQTQMDYLRAAANPFKYERFAPGTQAMLNRIGRGNQSLNWLINRTGRAVEAGLEGAVMGIMTDADPTEMAQLSAGMQAGGSLATQITGSMLSGGYRSAGNKLALAAGGTWALFSILERFAPGGIDRVLATLDTSFDKVAATVGVGIVGGLLGAGRITNPKLTAEISDQLTALLRGNAQSILSEMTTDRRIEIVVNAVRTNPLAFGSSAMRRLESAFTKPDVSMTGTIDSLMDKDPEFRRKYLQMEIAREQR